MKKNDDNKYIRIGIFAVVFLLGLFVSIKEKNGWIALIACVGVPLLYIPYGISDWKRKKQDNPPEKHNEPAKNVAPKVTVKKKITSEPPQQANSAEKSFTLLGWERGLGCGTSVWMRPIDKGFEVIVEYHAPNPFEHFGTSAIVPSEIIRQMSLQALQNWMYTITTPAFHEEITAKEEEYRQFLRECGVTKQTTTEFKFTYSIGTAFEKIRNTAKEKFIYCLDFKEPHHTIGHYRAFVDPRATIDLFFEQIDESGAIFDSGVIFAHWTITKNCDNSDAETKPERSDIYILTDSAYHNILDMLGAWESL